MEPIKNHILGEMSNWLEHVEQIKRLRKLPEKPFIQYDAEIDNETLKITAFIEHPILGSFQHRTTHYSDESLEATLLRALEGAISNLIRSSRGEENLSEYASIEKTPGTSTEKAEKSIKDIFNSSFEDVIDYRDCYICGGDGDLDGEQRCPKCKGTGQIEIKRRLNEWMDEENDRWVDKEDE